MKTKPQTPSRPFRPVLPTTGQRFPNLHVCALKKALSWKKCNPYIGCMSMKFVRTLRTRPECCDPSSFLAVAWISSDFIRWAQWCFWLAKSFASQRAFRLSIQSLPNKLESTTAMVRLISVINVAGIPWHLSNERKMTKPYSRHTKPIAHFNSNIPVTFDGFWPQTTSLSCLYVFLSDYCSEFSMASKVQTHQLHSVRWQHGETASRGDIFRSDGHGSSAKQWESWKVSPLRLEDLARFTSSWTDATKSSEAVQQT